MSVASTGAGPRGTPPLNRPSDGLVVAVPLYKAPELLPDLTDALLATAHELRTLDATVVLIDDSPDHGPLQAPLDLMVARLRGQVAVERLANPSNLGFVRTANRAMALAHGSGRDVILLNSDARPRPGAFTEMRDVAYLDPLIGFVNPRSDNATLCNSPIPAAYRAGGGDRAFANHQQIAGLLPRHSYVPTAVGFCLYVKRLMIEEFGAFDEVYGQGYNEENDFVRRCNRRGYRAALANRAYVHHVGQASFAHSEVASAERDAANRVILDRRYPEYGQTIARHFESAGYATERLASGLIPAADGRHRIVFDCRILKPFFSGTTEHIRALLTAFAAGHGREYEIGVIGSEEAFAFHGLDQVPGLRHRHEDDVRAEPAAAVLRIGQPFSMDDLLPLAEFGAVTGVLMLDTIAMDCQQLDENDLETLWQAVADTIDLIGFNSGFSRDQFVRRFAASRDAIEFVAPCSLDTADYAAATLTRPATPSILLVGNHYPHKAVIDTLAALQAAGNRQPVVVFGVEVDAQPGVVSMVAGDLPEDTVTRLYDDASVVLFPSHYEGFGLPILHGLARGRPVIARDLPSAREIKEASPLGHNLHLAATTAEMVALAIDPPGWRPAASEGDRDISWNASADAVADAIGQAIAGFDFARCRRRQGQAALQRRIVEGDRLRPGGADGHLPPLGRGFMLGDAMADAFAMPTPRRLLDRFAPCRRRDLLAPPPADQTQVRALTLLCRGQEITLDHVVEHVLPWLRTLIVGGRLTLDLPSAVFGGDRTAATVALLACGCRLERFAAAANGRASVAAVKVAEWTGMLPGPDDDTAFVRMLYRTALGRDPDPEGGRGYLHELEAGRSRLELLRRFCWSPEREALIARRLRALGII